MTISRSKLLGSLVPALCVAGSMAGASTLNVTFTNGVDQNTGAAVGGTGIFFTPVFTALHNGDYNTFDAGGTASAAVEALAEDGAVGGLVADAQAFSDADGAGGNIANTAIIAGTTGASGVFNGDNDQPPLLEPGEVVTTTLDATGIAGEGVGYFSFLSMILPSNDFFIGNADENAHMIFDAAGNFADNGTGFIEFNVYYEQGYDAGTEVNDSITDLLLPDGSTAPGLANAPFVPGGQGGPNQGPTEGGTITSLADPNLSLAGLVGSNTPAGVIDFVPTGAPGNNLFGTFRIELADVAPVPLPASAPLLLGALGLMGWGARRRQNRS